MQELEARSRTNRYFSWTRYHIWDCSLRQDSWSPNKHLRLPTNYIRSLWAWMKKTEKTNQLFCFRIGTYRRFPPSLIRLRLFRLCIIEWRRLNHCLNILWLSILKRDGNFSPLSMGFFPSVSKGFPAKRYLDDLADLGKRSSLCAYQTRRPGT